MAGIPFAKICRRESLFGGYDVQYMYENGWVGWQYDVSSLPQKGWHILYTTHGIPGARGDRPDENLHQRVVVTRECEVFPIGSPIPSRSIQGLDIT